MHIKKLMRRMLNCSPQLSWAEVVVPVLETYMRRMSKAGYSEAYHHDVLTRFRRDLSSQSASGLQDDPETGAETR